jgi:hypothetical protein
VSTWTVVSSTHFRKEIKDIEGGLEASIARLRAGKLSLSRKIKFIEEAERYDQFKTKQLPALVEDPLSLLDLAMEAKNIKYYSLKDSEYWQAFYSTDESKNPPVAIALAVMRVEQIKQAGLLSELEAALKEHRESSS